MWVLQSTEWAYASTNETARRKVEESRVEIFCQICQYIDSLDEMRLLGKIVWNYDPWNTGAVALLLWAAMERPNNLRCSVCLEESTKG